MKNELVEKLIELLGKHEDWEYDTYTIHHRSGLQLWISLMPFFIQIYKPATVHFSTLEKIKLWKPISKCLKAAKNRKNNRKNSRIIELIK